MTAKPPRSDRKNQLKCGTRVHDVPDECLALVFSRLHCKQDRDAASLVCRRWRSLEALSRHSIKVYFWRKTWSATQWSRRLLLTLHTFPNIYNIEIFGNSQYLPGPFLSGLRSKHFMQIRTLSLCEFGNLGDKFLACLAEGCPALISLELNQMGEGKGESSLTDVGIEMVLARCPYMEEMIIHWGQDIKGWGFRQGKQLKRLDITLGFDMDDSLAEGLQGPTSLHTLKLPFMEFACLDVTFLGECCKHIEVLSLSVCEALNDFSIKAIASGCKNLRILDVSNCYNVYLRGWTALACDATNLQVLDVSQCEFCPGSLLAIQNGCPALYSITVTYGYLLSYSVIQSFKRSRPSVCVHLEEDDDNLRG